MLFEELGLRYFGPIDGHNIAVAAQVSADGEGVEGPVLLHVVTEKGHGFEPAAEDPVLFHTPPPFDCANGDEPSLKKSRAVRRTPTSSASDPRSRCSGIRESRC